MPSTTNRKTAEILKKTIKKANKFILIATEDAISSKWCNWELGLGDAYKCDSGEIAIFFFKNRETDEKKYKGNEYMSLYPYIVYRDGTTKYSDGNTIEKGYYVRTKKEDGNWNLVPSKHGGNVKLRKLHDEKGDEYFEKYFTYTLLEYFGLSYDPERIKEREQYWKKCFDTIKNGYNDN